MITSGESRSGILQEFSYFMEKRSVFLERFNFLYLKLFHQLRKLCRHVMMNISTQGRAHFLNIFLIIKHLIMKLGQLIDY